MPLNAALTSPSTEAICRLWTYARFLMLGVQQLQAHSRTTLARSRSAQSDRWQQFEAELAKEGCQP